MQVCRARSFPAGEAAQGATTTATGGLYPREPEDKPETIRTAGPGGIGAESPARLNSAGKGDPDRLVRSDKRLGIDGDERGYGQ